MYKSELDDERRLEIPYDPIRRYNGATTMEDWDAYPYKSKMIDAVMREEPRLTFKQSAGLLLITIGNVDDAIREVALSPENSWPSFSARYDEEREAFFKAKKNYLIDERNKMAERLAATAKKKRDAKEVEERKRLSSLERVKRYDNGDKYEGAVMLKSGQIIPDGEGTLWVPEHYATGGLPASEKKYKKYCGFWAQGKMHGKGTIYWQNGDSWEGTFSRNDLQGKGIYRSVAADGESVVERGRYYQDSRHVAWLSDLQLGCHIEILPYSVGSKPQHSEDFYVIRDYNPDNDRHLIEKCVVDRPSKWICLSTVPFRITHARPMTDVI